MDETVTLDEWLSGQLALAARKSPSSVADADVVIETIETLRTLRRYTAEVAARRGLSLNDPIGPDRAAQLLNEAAPIIARSRMGAVQ